MYVNLHYGILEVGFIVKFSTRPHVGYSLDEDTASSVYVYKLRKYTNFELQDDFLYAVDVELPGPVPGSGRSPSPPIT